MAKAGPKTTAKKREKVATVMHEFKEGALKSSSGQQVTNPKQGIAIALAEAGMSRPKATRKPAFRQKKRPPDVVTVQRS